MKCEAIAVRTGAPCRNDAIGDSGACDVAAHQRQVAERRQRDRERPPQLSADELSADDIAPTWDSVERERELAAMMQSVPQRGESVIDEIAEAIGARNGAGARVDVDAFDRAVTRTLGASFSDEDPVDIDSAAAAHLEGAAAARADLVSTLRGRGAGVRFTPERCEWWIRVLVQPRLVRDGKDPLSDDELHEGAELAAEWLQAIFGDDIHSRTGRTVLWLGTVYGLRYCEELLQAAAGVGRWAQRRLRGLGPEPAPMRAVDGVTSTPPSTGPSTPLRTYPDYVSPHEVPPPPGVAGPGFGPMVA